MGGDMTAARIVLDRLCPVRRGRPVEFTPPASLTAAGLTEALKHVIDATACGHLTPDEAATLATVFEAGRRVVESEQLEERLRAIEKQLEQSGLK
jgi:hypothetical protein